jgi:hypothetical protein
MRLRFTLCLAALLLVAGVSAAGDLKSGPQVGEGISGKFLTHCVNGTHAGKNVCPV